VASFLIGMSRASIWIKHLGSLALGLGVGFAVRPFYPPTDQGLTPYFSLFILYPLVCRFAAYCGQGVRRLRGRSAEPSQEAKDEGG